ncbi:MAG: head-tail connector protein [Pseudomonadota bacterium]
MILIELTQVPDADLPVAAFRDHLQLGSGFADDGLQDAVLLPRLRAALSAVEARTGKALLEREFKLVVTAWRDLGRQVLPTAPVRSVDALTIVDLNETAETIPPAAFRLLLDAHTPSLEATALSLPIIPVGGTAEIEFTAGFGDWAAVPGDLQQAVLLMATHFYENRSAVSSRNYALPLSVASLCRPHTPIRLVGVRRP